MRLPYEIERENRALRRAAEEAEELLAQWIRSGKAPEDETFVFQARDQLLYALGSPQVSPGFSDLPLT